MGAGRLEHRGFKIPRLVTAMRVQVPPWALQFTESSAFPAVLLNDSHQPRRSKTIGVFLFFISVSHGSWVLIGQPNFVISRTNEH